MADRLTTTPKRWFVECLYCNPPKTSLSHQQPRRHEVELLSKAKRLCKNHGTNHFLDYVTAELDTLDHSILTPITMIEILNQIHTSIKCDCLTNLSSTIQDLTHNTNPSPSPTKTLPSPSPTQTPKRPPTTLLERIRNGKSTQQRS